MNIVKEALKQTLAVPTKERSDKEHNDRQAEIARQVKSILLTRQDK